MIVDESDKMKSTKKKQPSKKVLFQAIDLIESFALYQNDIAKQLQKYNAQLSELLTSSSNEKQSAIPIFWKTCVTE